jgi:hypothetical protein
MNPKQKGWRCVTRLENPRSGRDQVVSAADFFVRAVAARALLAPNLIGIAYVIPTLFLKRQYHDGARQSAGASSN